VGGAEAPVVISRPDLKLTGKGMTYDLKNRRLEVASDAKVVITNLEADK